MQVARQQFYSFHALFSIMILGYNESIVTGMVTFSPMSVAPVCRVGDPVQITCTASVEFIRWRVLRINGEKVINDEIINSEDTHQMTQSRANSATVTITRTSAQGDSPLVSTLSIDSVDIGLNGTVVNCTDLVNSTDASTTIHIIDVSQNIQYTPMLNISHQHYGAENVTVTVEWTQQTGVTYTVKVSPSPPTINPIETTRYEITIPYNKTYNFTVVAATPCRANTTNSIALHYGYCGHPELLSIESNDSVPIFVSLDNDLVPMEARFTCPSGFELTGPNLANCTGNGEWEPDPSLLMCNVSSSEGPTDPTDNRNLVGVFAAAAVALIILCIASTVMTATILFCRRGFRNKKQHKEYVQGKQVASKDITAEVDQERGPKNLIYVDVSISSKHKKRKMQTLTPTQGHDLDVEYSAIKHDLILCDHKNTVQVTEGDNVNVVVTLDTLLILLREQVSPKWREFGEAVGIDDMVLDSIANTCSPFVELLDYWLKYYDGRPTWSVVAKALRDIDLQKLARDIEHVHESGDLPSEADTYVNVTVKTQAPLGSYNESESDKRQKSNSNKFPSQPTASKPEYGIHLDATAMMQQ